MLRNIKRIAAVVLLLCPLTFLGQGKDDFYFVKGKKGKPITKVKENYDGRPNSFAKKTYILASAGPAFLQGDNSGLKAGYNGNIGLSYQINKAFALEATLGYASLTGESPNYTIENLDFYEAKLNLMLDLNYVLFGPKANRKFNVYPHIGFGQIHSRAEISYPSGVHYFVGYEQDNKNCRKGNGIGGRNIAAVIPVGIDFGYSVTNNLKLHLDFVVNYADTDLLDVFPYGHTIPARSNDYYSAVNFRLQFKFNKIKRTISACDCTF
jgi:hypothetical protein